MSERLAVDSLMTADGEVVQCPSCGMSNSIAWGSLMATPRKEAAAMLADSWNSR